MPRSVPRTYAELLRRVKAMLFAGQRAADIAWVQTFHAGELEPRIVAVMSTVTQIETAVEKLTPEQLREFAAWFEERQALLNSSESLLRMYDEEERAS